jgi:hypothetical protein
MWPEAVVTDLKVLSRHLAGEREENHQNPQSCVLGKSGCNIKGQSYSQFGTMLHVRLFITISFTVKYTYLCIEPQKVQFPNE